MVFIKTHVLVFVNTYECYLSQKKKKEGTLFFLLYSSIFGSFSIPFGSFYPVQKNLNRGQCELISGKPYSLSYLTDHFWHLDLLSHFWLHHNLFYWESKRGIDSAISRNLFLLCDKISKSLLPTATEKTWTFAIASATVRGKSTKDDVEQTFT